MNLWTGQNSGMADEIDLCELLDWDYYYKRFENCLFRLVVVPSGLQGLK